MRNDKWKISFFGRLWRRSSLLLFVELSQGIKDKVGVTRRLNLCGKSFF
jgi:hypothetical protein